MNILYDAIFKRKSIRKYDTTDLATETLSEIKAYASTVTRLIPEIKIEFLFLETEEVSNLLPIKAPHYLCIYSESKAGYLMNAGFILQEMDLYLSSKDIGSCWLGMGKPNKKVPANVHGLDFVIMMAFGGTPEPVHRSSISEFRRKELIDMTLFDKASTQNALTQIFEAVRISPSATNSQPWFFSCYSLDNGTFEIVVSREKLGIIKAALYDKMNQIDIGICLRHLELSAKNAGKEFSIDFKPLDCSDPVKKGYEYMSKVTLK